MGVIKMFTERCIQALIMITDPVAKPTQLSWQNEWFNDLILSVSNLQRNV